MGYKLSFDDLAYMFFYYIISFFVKIAIFRYAKKKYEVTAKIVNNKAFYLLMFIINEIMRVIMEMGKKKAMATTKTNPSHNEPMLWDNVKRNGYVAKNNKSGKSM